MTTLQDEQPAFDRAVCDAMVVSAPDDWSIIELTIERPDGTTDVGDFSHSLYSPEGFPSVMPDDSLYEATYRLDELFRQHRGIFRRAIYRVELFSDSWTYSAKFDYDDSAKM